MLTLLYDPGLFVLVADGPEQGDEVFLAGGDDDEEIDSGGFVELGEDISKIGNNILNCCRLLL
jgi:hypothetical protein